MAPPPTSTAGRLPVLLGLARLLAAGVSAERALSIIAGDGARTRGEPIHAARRRLGAGQGLAAALAAAGLLRPGEAAVIDALERTGDPATGLRRIAERLEAAERRWQRIRSGLALPIGVLLVGAAVAPLPALVRGTLGAPGYLVAALLPVALLLATATLAARHGARVLAALRRWRLSAARAPTLAERETLFWQLGQLLAAGLDAERSLAVLAGSGRRPLQQRLLRARRRVARGEDVAASLRTEGLLARGADDGLLAAGEAAGRLPDTLLHLAGQLDGDRERRAELLAEWLPRLVYAGVIAWLLRGML